MGGLTPPDFKTSCKGTIIKLVSFWHKERPVDQKRLKDYRVQKLIHTFTVNWFLLSINVPLTKVHKQFSKERLLFSTNDAITIGCPNSKK